MKQQKDQKTLELVFAINAGGMVPRINCDKLTVPPLAFDVAGNVIGVNKTREFYIFRLNGRWGQYAKEFAKNLSRAECAPGGLFTLEGASPKVELQWELFRTHCERQLTEARQILTNLGEVVSPEVKGLIAEAKKALQKNQAFQAWKLAREAEKLQEELTTRQAQTLARAAQMVSDKRFKLGGQVRFDLPQSGEKQTRRGKKVKGLDPRQQDILSRTLATC